MHRLIILIFLLTITVNASEVPSNNPEVAQKNAVKALSKTKICKRVVHKIEKLLKIKEYPNFYATIGIIIDTTNSGKISTKRYKFLRYEHSNMKVKPEFDYNIRNHHYGAKLLTNWSF